MPRNEQALLVDGEPIDYSGLPENYRETVARYFKGHCDPGTGWRAILSNDLNAVLICDAETAASLPKILIWLHNHAPSHAYGSVERVLDWMLAPLHARNRV